MLKKKKKKLSKKHSQPSVSPHLIKTVKILRIFYEDMTWQTEIDRANATFRLKEDMRLQFIVSLNFAFSKALLQPIISETLHVCIIVLKLLWVTHFFENQILLIPPSLLTNDYQYNRSQQRGWRDEEAQKGLVFHKKTHKRHLELDSQSITCTLNDASSTMWLTKELQSGTLLFCDTKILLLRRK